MNEKEVSEFLDKIITDLDLAKKEVRELNVFTAQSIVFLSAGIDKIKLQFSRASNYIKARIKDKEKRKIHLKILNLICNDNHYTRKSLSDRVKEEFGDEGFEILQEYWRLGHIAYCKLHGLTIAKKGLDNFYKLRREFE